MKINILSPGRSHLCNLAVELEKQGHDVAFYSFVPALRAARYGLPRRCSRSLVVPMLPFVIMERKLFRNVRFFHKITKIVLDYLTKIYMRKCDVAIVWSGFFTNSVAKAKRQGSKIIIERGNVHILTQREIFEKIPNLAKKDPVPDFDVNTELKNYAKADYISVGSTFVKNSFLSRGFPAEKIYLNCYGVDVSIFTPGFSSEKKYDVIMVGGWSYRKGCDLIVDAIRGTGLKFLHVGMIVDCPFPKDQNFTHVPAVDEINLPNYYRQAKVFIFPSREDGFGMVLLQAVACNLPIVGSLNCGAKDIKDVLNEYGNGKFIEIIDPLDFQGLRRATLKMLESSDADASLKFEKYAESTLKKFSWTAYGERYSTFLHNVFPNK